MYTQLRGRAPPWSSVDGSWSKLLDLKLLLPSCSHHFGACGNYSVPIVTTCDTTLNLAYRHRL